MNKVDRMPRDSFFLPFIMDDEVAEEFTETTAKWRKLATELNYVGPVVWKVKKGFTLKKHAPKAGPCCENFQYLKNWNIRNDEPTKDSLAFWVPRLVQGSTSKNVEEQITILAELRQRFSLSEYHLSGFGNVSLNSGLILAHFKHTGERTPLNGDWARTDSIYSVGGRLGLGDFDARGLYCYCWSWLDDGGDPDLGCFPLGVELAD